jgi:predicted murein hydrolase (TIGR00659 family)
MPLSAKIIDIWVYLSAAPLLWLTLTLAAYALAIRIAEAANRNPIANPVAIATAILVAILALTNTDYKTYFSGAQFVHFLLGPATVALAIPLYLNRARVMSTLTPMLVALLCGSVTAILSAVATAKLLGAPANIIASLAPKSVSAPIAMSLSANFGGLPTLTAVLVISTGILGAVIVTPLMNLLRIKDYQARGFAAGLSSHGIGTARAFQVNALAGTFAGIALGLNGALTSIILPFFARLWQ